MKELKGYEGKYKITEDGRVWSEYTKNFLKPEKMKYTNSKGEESSYLRVSIAGQKILVHRLMADNFDIPSVDGIYEEINHKDHNRENNDISNLEWCSRAYNQKDRNFEKMSKTLMETKEGKYIRCLETGEVFRTLHEASRQLNIKVNGICNMLKGRSKSAGGLHFEYV